ncbi:hypothetical protein TSTA_029140 [Talaromyces stipitatus ATCC 10500]|uniref:Uncharacterized protein n=1 Tax=Talaromyces stipitatus (strain ATCC 10500 / CBS 375.48 / QM 6759 / NRRL 1006) TaxID=441959 RepID=B8M530_TALSN|nr:uncharacterized protein TSTA_029140 [Talaromyces stipitatus ATCC 10500]EED19636.1 hypothetical protein TSTA_029140 [Talaromyces stipitatus ATCC 10500]
MVKTWRRLSDHDTPKSDEEKEAAEVFKEVHIEDDKASTNESVKENAKAVEPTDVPDMIWNIYNSVTACANCDLLVTSASHWYFCRSCPHMVLYPACYRNIQSSNHAPRTCNSQHEFYYTGKRLRFSECAEEGMIRLTSIDSDEVKILWVEEWKDRLAEKWGTKEFEFEGGLSSWCMQVLPEVQRERWATFFKV